MATLPVALLGGLFSAGGGLISGLGANAAGTTIGKTGTAIGNSIDTGTNNAIGAGYQGLANATTQLGQGWQQVGNTNNLQSSLFNNNSNLNSAIYGNNVSGLQPYQTAGATGVQGIQSLMANTPAFSYNPANVSQDPAYQFELGQGTQALEAQAAAAGMLQSGSNEKGIENYAQGLASTFENQDYNQALNTYQTNFSNQLNGLNTMAGYGQNANAQNIQAGLGYGSTQTQSALGYGNQAGQTAGLSTTLAQAGANANLQGMQYIGNTTLAGLGEAGNYFMAGAQGTAAGQMGEANGIGAGLMGLGGAAGAIAGGFGGGGGVSANPNLPSWYSPPVAGPLPVLPPPIPVAPVVGG